MTNTDPIDPIVQLPPEVRGLAAVGGRRRPVRVVEHPAFRAARARLESPFTVARVPVASLNRAARAEACLRRVCGSTLATTLQETA